MQEKILKYLDYKELTIMSYVLDKDTEQILNSDFINWDVFKNKTFLVTGATGLVGSNFVKLLSRLSETKQLDIEILCMVRDIGKATGIFEKSNCIKFMCSDITDSVLIEEDIDYIIHAANPTASKYFINNPVETINTSVLGTMKMLELAKAKKVEGFVYLSTMEVYGEPNKGVLVTEEDISGFNPEKARNSYPISKQLCESLCGAYACEYGVPTRVLRLTQTFGPGVTYNDGRVFAEFMRCAIEKKDIILKTKGETERSYLYTADAFTAIMVALQKGKDGSCYTVANPDTYCSIKEMAELVAHEICQDSIKVDIQLDDISKYGYANTLHMNLDVTKMKSLGWMPLVGLTEMFRRAINELV